jgi:hypothetical protein
MSNICQVSINPISEEDADLLGIDLTEIGSPRHFRGTTQRGYSLWAKVMAGPRFGRLSSSLGRISSKKFVALGLSHPKLFSTKKNVSYLAKYPKIK